MNTSITTFLFDLDGCIADTLPMWLKSFQQTFKKFDVSISNEEIIAIGFQRIHEMDFHIDKKLFVKELYARYEANFINSPLHSGALHFLKTLKKNNYQTALVTSSHRRVVKLFLSKNNIDTFFDCTFAWEDTQNNKPHPEPLLEALKRLNSKPENSVMIGDSDVDILAAKAARVMSVWYHPPANIPFYKKGKFDHHHPDITIHQFSDLLSIIK